MLFVCKGNICRSPSAEAIFKKLIQAEGLEKDIKVDSAGTHGYHTGEASDSRMRSHAEKRGYVLDTLARKFNSSQDFDEFDYILTMDKFNFEHLMQLTEGQDEKDKIHSMCRFCEEHRETEVPDPYYEGPEGFEKVLNILEDATLGLLKHIKANHLK